MKLVTHTVATAGALAAGPAEIQLRLTPSSRYRAPISAKGGLYCIVRVTFTARGHAPLLKEIPVTLRRRAPKPGLRRRSPKPGLRRGASKPARKAARAKQQQ